MVYALVGKEFSDMRQDQRIKFIRARDTVETVGQLKEETTESRVMRVPKMQQVDFLADQGELMPFTAAAAAAAASAAKLLQSCPTLCDPIDCSLPGSSIHGIFQARVLEWVTITFLQPFIGWRPIFIASRQRKFLCEEWHQVIGQKAKEWVTEWVFYLI